MPTAKATPRDGALSHRNLLMLETLLLVGLGKEMLEWLVLEQSGLPPLLRVLLGMTVVVGTLGGLVLMAQRWLRRAIDRTHRKVQRRYKLPKLIVHVALLGLIFVAYAAFWDQETGALTAMIEATLALVAPLAAGWISP